MLLLAKTKPTNKLKSVWKQINMSDGTAKLVILGSGGVGKSCKIIHFKKRPHCCIY
jgi:GTPase SAR1 family protein